MEQSGWCCVWPLASLFLLFTATYNIPTVPLFLLATFARSLIHARLGLACLLPCLHAQSFLC